MKNKRYTIQVGSDEIKVWAIDGEIAIEKAIEIYNKKRGFFSRFRPGAHIMEISNK